MRIARIWLVIHSVKPEPCCAGRWAKESGRDAETRISFREGGHLPRVNGTVAECLV